MKVLIDLDARKITIKGSVKGIDKFNEFVRIINKIVVDDGFELILGDVEQDTVYIAYDYKSSVYDFVYPDDNKK